MRHMYIFMVITCLSFTPASFLFADTLTDSTWHFDYKRKGSGDFEVNFDKDGTFSGVGTSSKLGMMVIKGTYERLKKNKFFGKYRIESYDHDYQDTGNLKCRLRDQGTVIKCKIHNGLWPFGFSLVLESKQPDTQDYVRAKNE
jgi:hypothetical protein